MRHVWLCLLALAPAPAIAQLVSTDRIPIVVKAAQWVCPRYYASKDQSWAFYVNAAKAHGLSADERTLLISYCVLWGDGFWNAKNPPPTITPQVRPKERG